MRRVFFYWFLLFFFFVIVLTLLGVWIVTVVELVKGVSAFKIVIIFVSPFVFVFLSFIFPIIRTSFINHFRRIEVEKEKKFERLQMEKDVNTRLLLEAKKLIPAKEREKLLKLEKTLKKSS